MIHDIFFQVSVLLGVTAAIAVIVRALRQPLLVAYILAGIISGPILLDFIEGNDEAYRVFSQFGIVLLLFVLGLSLNFQYLKKIGKVAVVAGLGQLVLTALLAYLLLASFAVPFFSALWLGFAMTFSSTIIVTKLLSDKKDTESVYGRYTIGLMLVQDVIAIIMMLFITSPAHGAASLALFTGVLIVKAGVLVACIYFLAKFLIPFLLDHIAASAEFLFLFTLAWCFGIAALVHAFGFSLEIGAIMAGLSLGSSPYQPEISSRIRPLRDFFLIMFFIILGSQMYLSSFEAALIPGLALSGFVLLVKPLILYVVFRLMRFTRRNSFLVSTTGAQVSEFGFILLVAGALGNGERAMFTIVALVTIFISSYLITYNEQIYRFFLPMFSFLGRDRYQQQEDDVPVYDAWVIGYHRMGWKICETLRQQKISFAVIDFNPEIVKFLKAERIPVYFGDAADVEFLSELPLAEAKLVVSTIPEVDDQFTLIRHVRGRTKKGHIIANLSEMKYVKDVYAAGADYVMMPHLLGGYRISEILRGRALSRRVFRKLRDEQEKEIHLRILANAHD